MKFKVDENLPVEISNLLIASGYDAISVFEQGLQGQPDSIISKVCLQEERVLVTLDLDFADIRQYPPEMYFGIVVTSHG